MYDFHYNYIREKYKDKAKLLFTDTDSLIYHIETEDVYADIRNDVDRWFDTSDYKEDYPSRIRTEINKKVPGKFRDEARWQQVEEVVALCPKWHSIEMYEDGKEEKKCRGITKAVTRNTVSHEDYKNCLFTGKKQMRTMNIIRSDRHEVYSVYRGE